MEGVLCLSFCTVSVVVLVRGCCLFGGDVEMRGIARSEATMLWAIQIPIVHIWEKVDTVHINKTKEIQRKTEE